MWPFKFASRRKRGLPNMIVYLLSSSPKNGMELMDGVESITRGWWRPTPGSIYPLLKEMTDQGILRKLDDNRYELTAKGKTQAEHSFAPRMHRPRTVEDMVGQMEGFVSYMEDAKTADQRNLEPHMEKLKKIVKRLTDLTEDGKRAAE